MDRKSKILLFSTSKQSIEYKLKMKRNYILHYVKLLIGQIIKDGYILKTYPKKISEKACNEIQFRIQIVNDEIDQIMNNTVSE